MGGSLLANAESTDSVPGLGGSQFLMATKLVPTTTEPVLWSPGSETRENSTVGSPHTTTRE